MQKKDLRSAKKLQNSKVKEDQLFILMKVVLLMICQEPTGTLLKGIVVMANMIGALEAELM